jgi:hypothetical protein
MNQGMLRSLCFHDAWGYPPTVVELETGADIGRDNLSDRPSEVKGIESRGRVVLTDRESLIAEHELRERLFARKLRRARCVTAWLRRIAGVRFVALCNTTALANASDEGDLDFFIVTRTGSLWQTRGWAALPFKLLRLRPGGKAKDPVCFSFFVDETTLDLSFLTLEGDDPYFRHWFLSLLPLYDDGVGERLWEANAKIRERHPQAVRWLSVASRNAFRVAKIPTPAMLDRLAQFLQMKTLPKAIRQRMNLDTSVVIRANVLKSHVDDGRTRFRERYEATCRRVGIVP